MKYILPVLVGFLLMSGCSTSRVIQIGPELYTLSATRCGLCAQASAYVTEKASSYCVKQNRFLLVRSIKTGGYQPVIPGNATINFSCVTEDDPEYTRPNMRKDNGVTTIEMR